MNIEDAIRALVDAGVEFVIVGGWSAVLNGSMQCTGDLDICYARNPGNSSRLARVLAPVHPRLRDLPAGPPLVLDETTLQNSSVIRLNTDLGEIGLMAEIGGLGTFEEMAPGSVATEAFGRRTIGSAQP
jgi:hypothetical protein